MSGLAAPGAVRAVDPASPPDPTGAPVLELRGAGRAFGSVEALRGVDLRVDAGTVTCVLGDNGAGKSTLIKILSGAHRATSGELRLDGRPVRFSSPREAIARGIATVYQDLATVPLMPVWRNFFLGNELTLGPRALGILDVRRSRRVTLDALHEMGIELRDPDQPIGTLSGGERQAVAIARAVHFGAKVLILDEPTSALGVRQSGIVLRYVLAARDRGVAVVLITHNPHHAFLVGDRFTVLARGRVAAEYERGGVELPELVRTMSGGEELDALAHELRVARPGPAQ